MSSVRSLSNLKVSMSNDGTGTVPVSNPSKSPAQFIYYSLTESGGSAINMGVDGSSTPVAFEYVVPSSKVANLSRITGYLRDTDLTLSTFIGGTTSLNNGLLIQVLDSDGTTVLQAFDTDREPIKYLAEFSSLAGADGTVVKESGVGEDMFTLRWTIEKAGAKMQLTAGQIFRITVRDNLLGLIEFRLTLQGILEDA